MMCLRKKKQYLDAGVYENKLARVMERLAVSQYEFNWDRWSAWVQFRYKDSLYRFEHSVHKAKDRGQRLDYGSDAFAQIVLSLEDIARMVERGIYELSTWVAGMKMLPPVQVMPECFRYLRYESLPAEPEDIRERYRQLAREMHPDTQTGSPEAFKKLQQATEEAMQHLLERRQMQ